MDSSTEHPLSNLHSIGADRNLGSSTSTNTQQSAAPSAPLAHSVPAAKWIQDNEESDNDQIGLVPHNREAQFGGNKLRAPRKLAEESEYTKAGKKRTVVKRKKRRLDEEISDEEEDPYTLVNIEGKPNFFFHSILSPIESPTDIVRRPALRRIIQSRQVEGLAKTAMEFIEGEKNFNKILCRLCAILHHDDPRYLDLKFERTPEERRAKRHAGSKDNATKDIQENRAGGSGSGSVAGSGSGPGAGAGTGSGSGSGSGVGQAKVDQNGRNLSESETKKEDGGEPTSHMNEKISSMSVEEGPSSQSNDSVDAEAQEVVRRENINFSNEYLLRLQGARDKLYKAHMQKDALWSQLCTIADEQDRRQNYRDSSNIGYN
ncbi:hypothetical protein PHYBLDRAFT_143506 [Phycomyces blakesleeanus NRRL 1555(-)]|uniref:Transcriptional regulatory protein RXT2 N-terminal domain-containing protein n=1 Tax=Phycomyces blakesleeanus (strain ATCC 8743b / DSM 1359 / FGSC 10004 / NBRC 33097 / NRRL 1555) TaxID=763407 RepID=A0A167N7N3_PHYB8|nr:hypothetical protein PHYBLDRAFT_143506 [Phycomyces blakesleeanus NRRL 1555(-)]OAD75244.1 hypothetical protein PHYBLDRAFT_143506 [Phycomyces blakesleeanus NRRL 1555(-)]|eukprot:XP_018293284.1 hypothetical protein PHYBLDRAFT_143506 [Phycomyces blakesleeanus NRRL 1555(-)]